MCNIGVQQFLPHEAQRYKERSTAECINARYKDEFGGYAFGHSKAIAHLMSGIKVLIVAQLMRYVD